MFVLLRKMSLPYITQPPSLTTPGKNGVPRPEIKKVKGTTLIAKHPKPVPALPPEMKDNAVGDIRYLSMKHGMNYSFVQHVFEDDKGHLWFATRAGVSRYDGRQFFHYSTAEGFIHEFVLYITPRSKRQYVVWDSWWCLSL